MDQMTLRPLCVSIQRTVVPQRSPHLAGHLGQPLPLGLEIALPAAADVLRVVVLVAGTVLPVAVLSIKM